MANPSTFKKIVKEGATKVLTSNDKRGKMLGNLYTGKKLNNKTALAVGAGAFLLAGGPSKLFGEETNNPRTAKDYNLLNAGKILDAKIGNQPIMKSESPMMQADGIIQETKDLGATGEIVFGLHNKRHG